MLKTTSSLRRCAYSRGDRLFTDVRVASSVDQTALVGSRQVLLTTADRLHSAIEREQTVACQASVKIRVSSLIAQIHQMCKISLNIGSCLVMKTRRAIPR